MIIDTLVVVVCFMAAPPRYNRFEEEFQLADSAFDQASVNAALMAREKIKKERQKILRSFDMQVIIDELKHNSVKP